MLSNNSIKNLYPLALAEGEGVGTAYEYFTKRLVLGRWLAGNARPRNMLIAGLPEKYGSSLDFFLLGQELGIPITIVDERPEAIAKCQNSLREAQAAGELRQLTQPTMLVAELWQENGIPFAEKFDLIIASETVQRLTPSQQTGYFAALNQIGEQIALFCPNKANQAHVGISGLGGLHLTELDQLIKPYSFSAVKSGYIDMPPFPPGITRTEDQREQAESGRFEAFAMWGLGIFARAEKLIPAKIRRSQSHIVYALCRR